MAGTHGGRAQGECLIAGILTVTGGCCCLKYLFAVKGTGGTGGGRNRQIGGGGGWGRGRGAERRVSHGLRDESGRKRSSRDRGGWPLQGRIHSTTISSSLGARAWTRDKHSADQRHCEAFRLELVMGENRQLAMSALALMGVMAGAAQSWSQTSSQEARLKACPKHPASC